MVIMLKRIWMLKNWNANPIYVFPEKEMRGLSTVQIVTFMDLWAIFIYSHDRPAYSGK